MFSIFCATWNVNNKKCDDIEKMCAYLLPNDQFVADVFAIGFQETVELSTRNVVFDGSKSDKSAIYWMKIIKNCFLSKGLSFVLLEEKHLVGNLLCVFIKSEIFPFVKGVRSAATPVGKSIAMKIVIKIVMKI